MKRPLLLVVLDGRGGRHAGSSRRTSTENGGTSSSKRASNSRRVGDRGLSKFDTYLDEPSSAGRFAPAHRRTEEEGFLPRRSHPLHMIAVILKKTILVNLGGSTVAPDVIGFDGHI